VPAHALPWIAATGAYVAGLVLGLAAVLSRRRSPAALAEAHL
jgi:hypothetical protein